jgi:hypothetical protein
MSATEPAGTGARSDAETARADAEAAERARNDTIDFFGASPSPTLPVPSAPPDPGPAPSGAGGPGPSAGSTRSTGDTGGVGGAPPVSGRERRGVRVRTVVFGLALLVVSAACLVSVLTRIRVDAGVVALAVLVGAGAALLIGGLSAAVADLRRGGTRYT